ncbi:ATP-binding protein [Varibaculum cambriense]|uniref:ATP-binding protein n=1 Tax=Varibaculum cambriense TaxID=184870 RepID=UPI0029029EF7|nr:ATP-binding protein [Varibaculum cambriense]MDU1224810.1 ATP-binding protein [Varibaculum cambriense]
MSDLQLKCPACGAPINFDVPSGKMKCNYCGAMFSVEEVNQFNGISAANQQLNAAYQAQREGAQSPPPPESLSGQQTDSSQPAQPGTGSAPMPPAGAAAPTPQKGWVEPPPTYMDEATGQQMAKFECDSCGGEIIGSADMVSAKCPWCNNNFVATGQLVRTRVPDRMIPFGMTKEQALAAFKKEASRLKLTPNAFKHASVDDIQGVYIPYWLYDASVAGMAEFECERRKTWSDSEYTYTKHDVYQVSRSGDISYLDVPVSGTSKVTNELTESIEPFDYSTSVGFSPAYLTGFMTNKYDVEAEEANPRALARMERSAKDVLRNSVTGYDNVILSNSVFEPAFGELEYVFLPVWLLNVDFQGKNYNYAMNGQTGKFVGTFPVSNVKYWGGLIGIATALAAVVGAVFIPYVMPWILN